MPEYYERHLPHWHPEAADVFVTWRLHGSFPADRPILTGPAAGKAFVAMDRALAKAATGPKWLVDERIAGIVVDALYFGESQLRLYKLHAWVVMANHVHILIRPHAEMPRITKAVKNYSARHANALLGRTGEPFWRDESYDHWIRSEKEFDNVVRYIEANPVAAGLVEHPEDWAFSSARWAGREACPTKDAYA